MFWIQSQYVLWNLGRPTGPHHLGRPRDIVDTGRRHPPDRNILRRRSLHVVQNELEVPLESGGVGGGVCVCVCVCVFVYLDEFVSPKYRTPVVKPISWDGILVPQC